ncbi:MAG: hypothetical protein WD740_05980 [Anaerolineales bacterium]
MDAAPSAQGLDLRIPWMNAAGSLGFAPDPRGPIPFDAFGAFVTNPISAQARRASRPPRQLSFPGGVLLHTGHPNPGLSSAIKRFAAAWARAPLPIIVHLLSTKPAELRKAVLQIEEHDNVLAIEVGVDADCSPQLTAELAKAAQGELPIIVQLPLQRASELAYAALEAGAAAISLGPARGALPGPDGTLISGRLYGPALFPQALEIVRELSRLKLPLIAAGGVETKARGEAMLAAGALAVQMDVGLWKSSNQVFPSS